MKAKEIAAKYPDEISDPIDFSKFVMDDLVAEMEVLKKAHHPYTPGAIRSVLDQVDNKYQEICTLVLQKGLAMNPLGFQNFTYTTTPGLAQFWKSPYMKKIEEAHKPFTAGGSIMFSHNKIIVALDGLDFETCSELVDKLKDDVWGFKFNDLLHHPEISKILKRDDVRFFIDVKLHDIPNTVKNTVKRIVGEYCPSLLTVHASGGQKMMEAAVAAADDEAPGKTGILAVTVLTSLDEKDCKTIYGGDIELEVRTLALLAHDAGVFGVVCSAHEIELVKDSKRKLEVVVPGIRPSWFQDKGDQKRVMTPAEAIKKGASALVIGRPITKADCMVTAAKQTHNEIMEATDGNK